MEARELRIGNLILCNGKITKVSYHHIRLAVIQFTVDGVPPNYKPIPLTPELLEQAGFKVFPWGYVKKASNDFGVRLNLSSFNYDVSGNNPVRLTYLHQLQNLYFSLTGEELINL